MNSRRKLLALTFAGLAGSFGFAGIQGAQAQAPLQDITYLLPAPGSLPAFGPWMVAKQRGYFTAEGLNVNFQVARGGVDVAKQVGAGNAVVGGAIGDTPIIVRSNGVPVKAIAVIGGRALMQLAVNKDKGINSVKDLKGKTITVLAYQDTTFFALLGMLATQGMTKNDVNAQAVGPVNIWKLFAAGQSDAMAGTPEWTIQARKESPKMNIEAIPSDTVFKSMAQAIVASDETIQKNPELLRKIVRATLKGMKALMDDPAAAAVDYAKAVPEFTGKEADLTEIFKAYNTLVYPGQKVLGEMDESRLSALQDFYLKEGIIEKTTPVKELYTNQFLQ
ncbi:ABC transporter substrate-binding protein [Methylocella sp. CPCC 101449]|jgi:NitT/TauT family transport system substrate-binding protein|uniref:ABC transporter substrate-binding protein n=1 Tax=Methylocella sp. CPCC 101449 TaxID=2987531 RepID=UPI00288CA2E2|nr:ABC transporter substrate-binding protein [Methylocella sp. CPCC 101449]MDT2022646.1 ABC transporter substrate-binding protein [Methylocella sp. CPCC 101449]HEV2572628.1 ABC transporter substrate-binding protein [Beijerinckiaceae bacterium]